MYSSIKDFGSNMKSLDVENPLSYCLNSTVDQTFLHSGNSYIYGQYSKPCQAFLSDYCAQNWDGFCELASRNTNVSFPNQLSGQNINSNGLTAGDLLVRNTASAKYLVHMGGNCVQRFEPFDPTVANSPLIYYWGSKDYTADKCEPYYAVDSRIIDSDPIMNKILYKPYIALDILSNIFETMTAAGTIHTLKGTKLGKFYELFPLKPRTF